MAFDEMIARNELADHFNEAVTDHADVMAECLSILRIYNLSPSDLFFKYEAFLLSRPSGLRAKLSVLSLDTLRELRSEIQREQQAKAVASMGSGHHAVSPSVDTSSKTAVGVRKSKGNMADIGGFLEGLSTPSRPAKTRQPSSSLKVATIPSGNGAFLPLATDSLSTPQRPTSAAATTAGSSYLPGPVSITGSHLETPVGRDSNKLSAPSSPVSPVGTPTNLGPLLTQPFHLRPQANTLVETLNQHLPEARGGVPHDSRQRVTLSSTSDLKHWNYRYMFEKISQRSEALDDLIDDYAENIKEAYDITELGDPHFVSEDSIYTVGRILSPPTDNKATTSSLWLESSRLLGAGRRIALRFAPAPSLRVRGGAPGVKGFGLFPGCLACVKGRNGGGDSFVVEEVLLPAPSALAQSSKSDLLAFQHGDKLSGEPLSMITAAGPYTLEDDLTFAPLDALIRVASDDRPDVLLLLGPFVDNQHPMIIAGAINQSPAEIFAEHVSRRLQRLVEASPATVIILIPSVRDIVSRHMAFPQSMLEKEALGLPKSDQRVKVLPNPCTFSINEIIVAVSTVDVLFHLRKEEIYQKAEEAEPDLEMRGAEVKDAMANLVRHVLGQRSFYPIFPAPEAHAAEINLDVTHYPLLKMEGPAPDVLVLPSKLKHFSKIIDSSLVLNPAYLARAHTGGTYAKIAIHPTSPSELESLADTDDYTEHQVWDRARSEIWRI